MTQRDEVIEKLEEMVRVIGVHPPVVGNKQFKERYMDLCRQLMAQSIEQDYLYNDYINRFYCAKELGI